MLLDNFQTEVGMWGEAVFPEATLQTITAHLLEEALELYGVPNHLIESVMDQAYLARHDNKAGVNLEEAADCFLLLLHLCHKRNEWLSMLAGAKLAINKHRVWKPDPEKAGHWKHDPAQEYGVTKQG
jgi:hypothetical protein